MADIVSGSSILSEMDSEGGTQSGSFQSMLEESSKSKSFETFLTSLIVIFAITLALLSYLEAQAAPNKLLVGMLNIIDTSIFSIFAQK